MTTGQARVKPAGLLGRERELALIRELVNSPGHEGAVLVVTGEPGIGKSALLAQVRAEALGVGYRVLNADGVESEAHLPFGGLQQIMSPLMALADSLPRPQAEALATALGLAEGPRPDLFLIAEAALALLALERTERRVLVLADDVQWLDPQSHQIFTFLAHRSPTAGLRLIGVARSGHTGSFMDAQFPTLEVMGVDEATAEVLLQEHARDLSPADRRRIQQEARGNPLALLELPVAWGTGPATDSQPPALSARLEGAFAGRTANLPAATRDMLLVAATGSSNDLAEILAATGAFRDQLQGPDVVEPAVRAGLVQVSQGTLAFRHPLVRSGVLQTDTVVRRQRAHLALSEVLSGDRFRTTWHRAQSIVGPDDRIADELEQTVADSLRRGAVISAVSSLERAAQLTTSSERKGRRLLEAGEYAFEVGRADVVGRLLQEASRTNLSRIDLARMDRLKESLNDDVRSDPARVMDMCTGARWAAEADDVDLALNLLVLAALRCWWAETGAQARTRVLQTLSELDIEHTDARYLCATAITEPVHRGAEVTRRLAGMDFDAITDPDSLRTYGIAAYGIGDLALATDLLDRSGQLLRASGRLGLLAVVLALQFQIRLDMGDWTGSAAASEEVDRVAVETGQALFAFNNVLVESRGMALRGQWETALDMVVGAEDDAAHLRLNDALCLSYQTRGAALLSADRPADAFEVLKRQFDPVDPGHHMRESFAGVALMAEAAFESGHLEEARTIVASLNQVAGMTPAPLLQVNLLYANAILATPDEAEHFFEAAATFDLSRWPWMRARVCLEHGRWLAGSGRPTEAESQLREAYTAFADMGAERWVRLARSAIALVEDLLRSDDPVGTED